MADLPPLETVREAWRARWPDALALWSPYTRLSEPRWCLTDEEAKAEGLRTSFAMIRLNDQAVVINLAEARRCGVEPFAVEILSHEIGHHMYAPSNLTDAARLLARMRRGLPSVEDQAPMVANLYEDLLINDRLHRTRSVDVPTVYRTLETVGKANGVSAGPSRLWTLYMRIYEILWRLPKRHLAVALDDKDAVLEGDAHLGARLVRVYAQDWMTGGGRFAALLYPYLVNDGATYVRQVLRGWLDAESPGQGAEVPAGLVEIDAGEIDAAVHPSADPALCDLDDDDDDGGEGERRASKEGPKPASTAPNARGSGGQTRLPFEFGALLKALGLPLNDHEVAMQYYRQRARPHLVPFPTRRQPESDEPQMEGLDAWDIGSPLDDVDWLESVMVSPRVVPGFTTRQRTYGRMAGVEPKREPIDLDIYVDCSGSMPNPQHQESYLALAGAIMALSALRAGARVQATLWSGPGQFDVTKGFITDEKAILRVITGYISGGTAFPLHVLVDTYGERARAPLRRKVHLMVISDDGVDTMLAKDERGVAGRTIVSDALARAGGGGTLLLNLYHDWKTIPNLKELADLGWEIFAVRSWEDLVAFARAFSRKTYLDDPAEPAARPRPRPTPRSRASKRKART